MMIRLDTHTIHQFIENRKREYSDERIGNYIKGAVISAYNFALEETPQWSGHMAANLTITVDGKAAPGINLKDDVWQKRFRDAGDQEVLPDKGSDNGTGPGRARNSWVNAAPFTITTMASLSYINEPSENYYAEVEAGNNLRLLNRPGQALARAEAYTRSRWGIRLQAPLKETPRV